MRNSPFLVGAGSSQAAHLKKPRRGFFPRRTIRRVDAVRIHPCIPFFKVDKTETPVPIGYRSSWWARVDSNKLNYHNSLDAL